MGAGFPKHFLLRISLDQWFLTFWCLWTQSISGTRGSTLSHYWTLGTLAASLLEAREPGLSNFDNSNPKAIHKNGEIAFIKQIHEYRNDEIFDLIHKQILKCWSFSKFKWTHIVPMISWLMHLLCSILRTPTSFLAFKFLHIYEGF